MMLPRPQLCEADHLHAGADLWSEPDKRSARLVNAPVTSIMRGWTIRILDLTKAETDPRYLVATTTAIVRGGQTTRVEIVVGSP